MWSQRQNLASERRVRYVDSRCASAWQMQRVTWTIFELWSRHDWWLLVSVGCWEVRCRRTEEEKVRFIWFTDLIYYQGKYLFFVGTYIEKQLSELFRERIDFSISAVVSLSLGLSLSTLDILNMINKEGWLESYECRRHMLISITIWLLSRDFPHWFL